MRRSANKLLIAAAGISCLLAQAQEAEDADRSAAIDVESESFSLDRPTNTMTFQGLRVQTGSWNLEADEAKALASELDFTEGEWQFKGNVRIEIGSALITAQEAAFTFQDQMLMMAALFGSPVVFEDTAPEREGPVQGRADRIELDNVEGTLRMTGDVALLVGPYETTGCDLIYYLNEEDFTTGSSDCEEPFTMVILPAEESEPESEAVEQP